MAKKTELKPRLVIQDGEEPVPAEILQRHIVEVAEQFDRAMKAGLTTECIVVLLHTRTGVPKSHIKDILFWAPRLATEFTTKGD